MNLANPKPLVVVNALVWATLMLATSWVVREAGSNTTATLLFLHIAGWITLHGLLSRRR